MRVSTRPRFSCEWLHSCSGCEISLLNCGEGLLGLFDRVRIVHFPLLMDHKYRDGEGEQASIDLPEADIGLVSGGVAENEHLLILRAMRARCRVLIACGTCATHGGIPAMRNQWPIAQAMDTVAAGAEGEGGMPSISLDRVYSLDEQVKVDFFLPGCPPLPETMVETIERVLDGADQIRADKSVCETCPTVREGSGRKTADRFLANAAYDAQKPLDTMRCLLEQGLLCLGPVTAGGCGGREAPLCLRARVPCRGCYGPVRPAGNPLLDMLTVLASKGIDHRTVVDRRSLLRFSGGHGLLKPTVSRR